MSVIATGVIGGLLVNVAKKVGATMVGNILKGTLGDAAGQMGGDLAGTIIDTIAGKAGVTPDALPDLPEEKLEAAVRETEAETPELVLAHVEQQKEANRLQLAEMDKEQVWSWAWRPATMWLIGFMWLWSLVLVPVINAVAGSEMPIYLDKLVWLTLTYMGLYMGGHTIKAGIASWKGRSA